MAQFGFTKEEAKKLCPTHYSDPSHAEGKNFLKYAYGNVYHLNCTGGRVHAIKVDPDHFKSSCPKLLDRIRDNCSIMPCSGDETTQSDGSVYGNYLGCMLDSNLPQQIYDSKHIFNTPK